MTLFAEDVPENHRILVWLILQPHVLGSCHQRIFHFTRRGDSGKVALDVGGKNRNSRF